MIPHRPGADPRAQLCHAKAEQYIQRLLAETPPLTAEERRDLTRLLTAPTVSEAVCHDHFRAVPGVPEPGMVLP